MLQKNIFIFCFLLAGNFFTASQVQCENWKEYFRDGKTSLYYDKDSIHYPKQKKNFIGVTVRDKNVVNVWIRTRVISTGHTETARQTFYCTERQCLGCGGNNYELQDFLASYFGNHAYTGEPEGIQPGSKWEILLKKVCP